MDIQTTIQRDGCTCRVDYTRGQSLAIPLDFDGPQPNFFQVDPARKYPVTNGPFVGDPARGGSCRVERIETIPHCQGTHTETVSHIVRELVPVADTWLSAPVLARLISVVPRLAAQVSETYRPCLESQDQVITAELLQGAWTAEPEQSSAVILRTRPNPPRKRWTRYDVSHPSPFLTIEAMFFLLEQGIQHLLVDFPSIDRILDEGRLTNHHLFWNIAEGTNQLTESARIGHTITELIYVPDAIPDGWYALAVHVPAWLVDAAPSRPMLYPLVPLSHA